MWRRSVRSTCAAWCVVCRHYATRGRALPLDLVTSAVDNQLGPPESITRLARGHQDDAVVGLVIYVEESPERQCRLAPSGTAVFNRSVARRWSAPRCQLRSRAQQIASPAAIPTRTASPADTLRNSSRACSSNTPKQPRGRCGPSYGALGIRRPHMVLSWLVWAQCATDLSSFQQPSPPPPRSPSSRQHLGGSLRPIDLVCVARTIRPRNVRLLGGGSHSKPAHGGAMCLPGPTNARTRHGWPAPDGQGGGPRRCRRRRLPLPMIRIRRHRAVQDPTC